MKLPPPLPPPLSPSSHFPIYLLLLLMMLLLLPLLLIMMLPLLNYRRQPAFIVPIIIVSHPAHLLNGAQKTVRTAVYCST